jgi:DNA-binding FadR family transcriptional regulator
VTYVFSPLGERGTTGAVVQRIASAIRSGHLAVGERLPSERALAAQLGVSRQTVRKAIRELVEAEILELRSGRGAHVMSDVVPLTLPGAATGPPEVGEISGILEARRLFEPRVAVLAGFLMTDRDYAAMAEVIDEQRGADVETVRRLDLRFHLLIAQATHNPTVVALMQALLERLDVVRYIVPTAPGEAPETVRMHELTLEAIASRDHARIEATMDEHLRLMESAWESFSGRALPREVPDFLVSVGGGRGGAPARRG